MEWIFKANIFLWMYGRGGTCKSVWYLLMVANPSQWCLKNKISFFYEYIYSPVCLLTWCLYLSKDFVFEQVKGTVSAHLPRLRKQTKKWKVWVVVCQNPVLVSSEFMWRKRNSWCRKRAEELFLFNYRKIFISDRLLQQRWTVRRWSIQKWWK